MIGTDLAVVREDLEYERRAYEQAARAPHDGRLANLSAWAAAQRRRRERIHELEAHEHALVSLEEAAAELRETYDPEYAA